MSNLDKIRSATLGAPAKGRTETVVVGDATLEVRAPSLKQQQTITRQATDKDGKVDSHKLAAYTLIACTWDPDTNVQAFKATDFDTVMSFGMTSWVGQLMNALGRVASADPVEIETSFEKTLEGDKLSSP